MMVAAAVPLPGTGSASLGYGHFGTRHYARFRVRLIIVEPDPTGVNAAAQSIRQQPTLQCTGHGSGNISHPKPDLHMDQLWAPWRLAYVANPKEQAKLEKADDCFICRSVAAANDRENLLLFRSDLSVVMLNRFPYNNGHLLVAPREHKGRPDELSPEQLLDLQLVLRKMLAAIEKCITPDGFNVGLNLGKVAGAGLPGHLHWHIVPRWNGDTNFMPVISDTKVIVQSLDALYDVLARELAAE